jgi:ribonuclease T
MTCVIRMRETVLSRGIMVDVEAAGPGPSRYALLSLGACVIGDPHKRFYVELKPDRSEYVATALTMTGLTLEGLANTGMLPVNALQNFLDWLRRTGSQQPLFVAHNAAFDWMFYADYCVRYGVVNPFGHKPFCTASAYGNIMYTSLPHHAGEDAYLQTFDLRRFYRVE